ncbi:hypothetical protein DL240_02575 [Lujinxingia litoralis]|uniref:Uncharacterized protein n=1 Tax=Lujinxingia litoralis TaxID=2211119 RepID=A0A328C921_9DELT|nr:hypothetical protein [Lujinxingia litoralis]RAL25117.1 hypothetical protein DL240_02575 [Lujinxingia litoralis]
MHWTFRHFPRLVVAGLLACSVLACGQTDDTSPPASQLSQTMEANPGPLADEFSERGDIDLLSRAAAEGDAHTLDASLEALYRVQGPVQLVTQGPIIDYSGHRQPVYIRHTNSPDLHLMITAGTEFTLAMRDAAGDLQELGYTYEEVDGGLARVQISASDLPHAGILLLGSQGADLEALGPDVFALAVIDDPLTCEGAERECEPGDAACMLKAHSPCITSNFDAIPALNEDAEPSQLITRYMESRSKFGAINIDEVDEENRSVTVSWTNEEVQPDRVLEVRPDGTQKSLEFERIDRRRVRLKASDEGFSPETLIALQAPGPSIHSFGFFIIPIIIGLFTRDKTWTYSGCIQFQNEAHFTPNHSYIPLHDIDVRISTSLDGVFFMPWAPARTDSKGCFTTRKKFRGPFAGWKRYARVQYRLRDGNFFSWNLFSVDGVFRQGFSIIKQTGKLSHSSSGHSLGTMTFAPGQPGRLGHSKHRRRTVSFDAMRRIDHKARTHDGWLGFNGPVFFNYPFLFNGVAVAPPSPVSSSHFIFVSANKWTFKTAVHEIAHAWHYKHRSGSLPNLPVSLVEGWSTHNCQEDVNVAFLEGFAEYFAHEALCGAIFDSGGCLSNYGHPRSLAGLRNDPTCIDAAQLPLLSTSQVIRQDNGVTHGLKLLTADHFNIRNFQSSYTYAYPNHATYLDPACYWSTMDYDFWDVLSTFKANPGKGYPSHFSTSPGTSLLDFFQRFAAVHQTHPFFLEPRLNLLNPTFTFNPSDICFERCTQPADMLNGQQISATPEPDYCKVTPVPANTTVIANGRGWFAPWQPICPVGTYDGANCHVLTPAPGVSPFIHQDQLYTTALPGGICPDGWYDGANCLIAQPPPGASAFIWEGKLYFTASYGCPMGGMHIAGNICLVGVAPEGTEATVAPGNILGYIE